MVENVEAQNMDVKKADLPEIKALIPEGFDWDAFDALKLVSKYGWKIVEIDGIKHVAAATKDDYEELAADNAKVLGSCQTIGTTDCHGDFCCRPWFDWRKQYWVCSC